MRADNFAMLITNNNRSKAYLQNLIANGFVPTNVLVLDDKAAIPVCTNQKSICTAEGFKSCFNEKESIYQTLDLNHIDYNILKTLDVNNDEVVAFVQSSQADFFIYAGPAGEILSANVLELGKPFLHAHPGSLPMYKGSTTMYYSILLDGYIGCSIIRMAAGIDSGDIVWSKQYSLPDKYINIDTVLDPIIRTETLIDFLKNLQENPQIAEGETQSDEGHTFFIIHPVLKHLAVDKIGWRK